MYLRKRMTALFLCFLMVLSSTFYAYAEAGSMSESSYAETENVDTYAEMSDSVETEIEAEVAVAAEAEIEAEVADTAEMEIEAEIPDTGADEIIAEIPDEGADEIIAEIPDTGADEIIAEIPDEGADEIEAEVPDDDRESDSFESDDFTADDDFSEAVEEDKEPDEGIACEECGEIDGHLETCSQYLTEEIAAVNLDEEPKIGDNIWIKSKSWVYKTQSASETGWQLWGNYKVQIVEIITDENNHAAWYQFKFTSLGLGELILRDYKYVHVENTSIEEPEETGNACNCGEGASENLAEHADSCPRKQYILSLVKERTAEEIFAGWEEYDEQTQKDIINIVKAYDPAILEALLKLTGEIKETAIEGMENVKLTLEGIPEGVTVSAAKVVPRNITKEVFEKIGNHKLLFSIDILPKEGKGCWQPEEGKTVKITLDANALELKEGERIGILHEHDGSVTEITMVTVTEGKIIFETDGFSTFYGYTVDFEYNGTWYSIGGGSDIYLYELFAMLGIGHSASEVTNVSFSDSSLLSISQVISDGYTGETTWLLHSLQPFDTEETMTISFTSGDTVTIKVYDANYDTLSNDMSLKDGDTIKQTTVSGNVTISISGTVTIEDTITIPNGASLTITGSGTLQRGASNIKNLFDVKGSLTISGSITLNGGASWNVQSVANSTRKTLSVSSRSDVTSAAIKVEQGNLTLSGVTFRNFYTTSQAAVIYSTGNKENGYATITMTGVTIQDCATMSDRSITLFNESVANLKECKYLNNYSGNCYAGTLKAGGPDHFSELTMTGCYASGNYSAGWGGVLLWAANSPSSGKSSKAIIDECTFENNTARYLGGALSNEAIMTVRNTTIKNNLAMGGGGIASFPFTLTEAQPGGGNACGLTLEGGNQISGNTAYAAGDFIPFANKNAGADGDDTAIENQITYTGGGGGVWCYMNKENWTCSLEIGSGNTITGNHANNAGGGVYVEKKAGSTTTLSVTGAEIINNSAVYGGGVAVKNADVKLSAGKINKNTASKNGGGIYVSEGDCSVSGDGEVTLNEAANGGGIYIESGSITVSGGIISKNQAKGNYDGTTAKDAAQGVGGGLYLQSGTFTLEGESVGLYNNKAEVAANDAYALGEYTTLNLPEVKGMNLKGWEGDKKPTGWFADYMSTEKNYPKQEINSEKDNPGRYDYNKGEENVEVEYQVLSTSKEAYYCLTLGTPYPGYGNLLIKKILDEPAKEDQAFQFSITGTTSNNEKPYSLTVTVNIKQGENSGSVSIANLPDGNYRIVEEGWSWRYDLKTNCIYPSGNEEAETDETFFELSVLNPDWVAEFTNTMENNSWLSGDCYCENSWKRNDISDASN